MQSISICIRVYIGTRTTYIEVCLYGTYNTTGYIDTSKFLWFSIVFMLRVPSGTQVGRRGDNRVNTFGTGRVRGYALMNGGVFLNMHSSPRSGAIAPTRSSSFWPAIPAADVPPAETERPVARCTLQERIACLAPRELPRRSLPPSRI